METPASLAVNSICMGSALSRTYYTQHVACSCNDVSLMLAFSTLSQQRKPTSACIQTGRLFALCDPKKKPECLKNHRAEPKCPGHKYRVAFGKTGKRKAAFDSAEEPPRKAPTPTSGKGSRSGNTPNWDVRNP